jgi:hypothetical protein
LEKVSCFSGGKIVAFFHHVSPAIHHKLTTKTPRFCTRFLQNPLQKRQSTTPEKRCNKLANKKSPGQRSRPGDLE